MEVVDLVGVTDLEVILEAVRRCAERNPGPASSFAGSRVIEPVAGSIPARMVSDPAGYFVIFPDRARGLISLEHYANNGVLSTIIEGHAAVELYMMAIDRNLVSRLDHAAYLGRELARRTRSRHRAALRAGRSTGTRSQHALWLHGVILRTGCCRYRHSGPA